MIIMIKKWNSYDYLVLYSVLSPKFGQVRQVSNKYWVLGMTLFSEAKSTEKTEPS